MIELENLSLDALFGCVPANVVDNRELCTALVGAAKAESIVKSTGFAVRRVLEPGRTVLDLMLPAARRALAGVDPAEVGGVVAVSFSAPERFPALAVRLQHELGLARDAAALARQMACGGYPYGLLVAGQLAAATATLVAAEGEAPARFAFYTDGAGADVLRCGADGKIRMDGFGVFRFVAGPVAAFLKGFHAANPAIDLFVPHQANLYMVRQLAKTLGLADRLLTSGERYANPGSCSVALTLAAHGEAVGRALLAGFGAGLAASAACVAIPQTCRRGVVET